MIDDLRTLAALIGLITVCLALWAVALAPAFLIWSN